MRNRHETLPSRTDWDLTKTSPEPHSLSFSALTQQQHIQRGLHRNTAQVYQSMQPHSASQIHVTTNIVFLPFVEFVLWLFI